MDVPQVLYNYVHTLMGYRQTRQHTEKGGQENVIYRDIWGNVKKGLRRGNMMGQPSSGICCMEARIELLCELQRANPSIRMDISGRQFLFSISQTCLRTKSVHY